MKFILFATLLASSWLHPWVATAQELTIRFAPPEGEASLAVPTAPVLAVGPEANATWYGFHNGRTFGKFVAGALTGFFAHEGGHLLANLFQGNVPRLQGLWGLGFIPFFTIAPRIGCYDGTCYKNDGSEFWAGPRGKFGITSAGFNVQHITDEIMLSRNPRLRYQVAPFQKGLLAFNTLLSIAYAATAITRIENAEGDLSSSAKLIGIPREVYATMLLIPAGLDLYRYFVPDSRWAPWVSRTGKLAVFGLVFSL